MTLSAAPGISRSIIVWLCCLGALAFISSPGVAADWPKLDKAELAETSPKIDPEAGAEILFREVVLDYTSLEGSEETHYTRAKIFSDRGVKYFSLVKIPYKPDQKISGIAARTIKPDGTIVELKSEDIHSREEHRDSEGRVRTKTFAFPGLEVGAIVEYKYYLSSNNQKLAAIMLFQSNLPARTVRYKVGMLRLPAQYIGTYDLRALSYHCPNQKLNPKDGFFTFELTNLPAVKNEPYSPPAVTNYASMLLYYSQSRDLPPADFWRNYSKELNKKYSSALKITPQITDKAKEIIATAKDDEDRLKKIYDWCRTNITNLARATTRLSAEERKALKKNESATDVLKSNKGTELDINLLFVALAKAAGFDARMAVCNNRLNFLYNEKVTEPVLIFSDPVAAVQRGGTWLYCNPGATYLPLGQLRARNTDTAILVGDTKAQENPIVVEGEPPETNCTQRKADLHIYANGAIEGDVTETYSGQEDSNLKNFLDDKSPDKRAEFFRFKLLRRFKQARISNITVENANDLFNNIKVSYHLRLPAYGEKTGSRIFFQPALFQKGGAERLTLPDGERKTPLLFPYRFQTKDEINIALPKGYTLEAASAPEDWSVNGLGNYSIQITFNRVTQILTYRREFNLTRILFNSTAYPKIKEILDKTRQRDDHTLTLKRDESVEAPEETPSPKETPDEPESKSPENDDSKNNNMEFSP